MCKWRRTLFYVSIYFFVITSSCIFKRGIPAVFPFFICRCLFMLSVTTEGVLKKGKKKIKKIRDV